MIAVCATLTQLIRSRLAALAEDVVETFTTAAGAGYAGDGTRADLTQFLDRYRAAAWEVAGQTFADEIERSITQLGS